MFLVPVRLSREQKRNCVELFKCLDVDQNGCLDEQEMLGAMLAQGYTQYQLSDARTLIKEYDIDGGWLSFSLSLLRTPKNVRVLCFKMALWRSQNEIERLASTLKQSVK